jgi:adenine-specific DNA-methyltransferase
MATKQETLLSIREVADLLRVSEITVKRYVANEVVPSFKIGGLRRIRETDLKKILDVSDNDSAPRVKKPKGGCELLYAGKKSTADILANTPAAKLRVADAVGDSRKNKLILGDNLSILKTLSSDPSVRGSVNLIYIDPPFGTGQEFIGYDEANAYNDSLVNTDFIEFLRERLIFMRELLAEDGSLYLHIDNKIGHYVKLILDEIFGEQCYRNDITRVKCNPKNFFRKAYGNIKDVIYFYSKSPAGKDDPMTWTDYRMPLTEEEIDRQFPKVDKTGRRYATTPLHAKGETRNGPTGREWKGLMPPKGRHWRYAPAELTRLDAAGLIEWSTTGNPRKIIYADENPGKKIQDIWDFRDPGFENSTYPTEKNLEMLKQIVLASSKKDGLVMDCFAGSGTTIVAAEMLGRRWIGVDCENCAIQTMQKRLAQIAGKSDRRPLSYTIYEAE